MQCSVCLHPDRETIDVELLQGNSLRTVEGRYGLSASALLLHRKEHLNAPSEGDLMEPAAPVRYLAPLRWQCLAALSHTEPWRPGRVARPTRRLPHCILPRFSRLLHQKNIPASQTQPPILEVARAGQPPARFGTA